MEGAAVSLKSTGFSLTFFEAFVRGRRQLSAMLFVVWEIDDRRKYQRKLRVSKNGGTRGGCVDFIDDRAGVKASTFDNEMALRVGKRPYGSPMQWTRRLKRRKQRRCLVTMSKVVLATP